LFLKSAITQKFSLVFFVLLQNIEEESIFLKRKAGMASAIYEKEGFQSKNILISEFGSF